VVGLSLTEARRIAANIAKLRSCLLGEAVTVSANAAARSSQGWGRVTEAAKTAAGSSGLRGQVISGCAFLGLMPLAHEGLYSGRNDNGGSGKCSRNNVASTDGHVILPKMTGFPANRRLPVLDLARTNSYRIAASALSKA
jgi:hypothetical protein